MKFKMTYAVVAITTVILTTVLMDGRTPVWGQEEPDRNTFHLNPIRLAQAQRYSLTLAGLKRKKSTDSHIRKGVETYQAAKTDEEKVVAEKAISSALSEYFEADMKSREQDIKEIEERVQKLRAQLEKRRAAKATILDLQLKVMINEAEGLGFYGRSSSVRGTQTSHGRSRPSNVQIPLEAPAVKASSR